MKLGVVSAAVVSAAALAASACAASQTAVVVKSWSSNRLAFLPSVLASADGGKSLWALGPSADLRAGVAGEIYPAVGHRTLSLPEIPVAANALGSSLWIAANEQTGDSGALYLLDTASRSVRRVPLPRQVQPLAVCALPHRQAWVASGGGSSSALLRISASGHVIANARIRGALPPRAALVCAKGIAYVVHTSSAGYSISSFTLRGERVEPDRRLVGVPQALAASSAGVWIATAAPNAHGSRAEIFQDGRHGVTRLATLTSCISLAYTASALWCAEHQARVARINLVGPRIGYVAAPSGMPVQIAATSHAVWLIEQNERTAYARPALQ